MQVWFLSPAKAGSGILILPDPRVPLRFTRGYSLPSASQTRCSVYVTKTSFPLARLFNDEFTLGLLRLQRLN